MMVNEVAESASLTTTGGGESHNRMHLRLEEHRLNVLESRTEKTISQVATMPMVSE